MIRGREQIGSPANQATNLMIAFESFLCVTIDQQSVKFKSMGTSSVIH
jgi:hypothetical protein